MKLLLVDDERYVIESIKKNICWERTGITEIYTAFTMKQAQEIITAVKMDIIISDIVMPAATGFDLVQWVREQNFRIQVIFLTSYAEFDYARRAIQLESVEYLLKPIDFEKLEEALKKQNRQCFRKNISKNLQKRVSSGKKTGQSCKRISGEIY
jgi:two-component system response regulator YesN